uniref:Putative histone H2B n=1 Tax=Helianthus annuus TaxID=4232 RepID=A0A251U6D9_HELAN
MAPKADKKPAEKKPAEEKAPAEKKPKAGKKLPKEAGSAAADKKKKRTKKSVETYKIYIFKVHKGGYEIYKLLGFENVRCDIRWMVYIRNNYHHSRLVLLISPINLGA